MSLIHISSSPSYFNLNLLVFEFSQYTRPYRLLTLPTLTPPPPSASPKCQEPQSNLAIEYSWTLLQSWPIPAPEFTN